VGGQKGWSPVNDLVFRSVKWMAEAIRAKKLSCVELIQAHLNHIGQANPRLNAVVSLAAETALEQARRMDNSRPDPLPPCYGVPMTVKEAWDSKGMVNSGGALGRKGLLATQDATVIARMKRAGMIPIGTTNLPEYSLAFESDNFIYGRSNNPYDVNRTPGGSGGGGAAAIASGCSPFEVGGDLGGSIRVPSHFCGIAGLKTTLGRVPLTGYFPGPFGMVTLMATAGPMARYVEDLALTLPLMAGPDLVDMSAVDAVLRHPADVRLSSLRLAFHTDNGIMPPAAETCALVEKAAQAMQGAAQSVEEARPEGIEQAMDLGLGLLGGDGGAGLMTLNHLSGTTENTPLFKGSLELFKPYATDAMGLMGRLAERDAYRMRIASFFHRFDALLCPTAAFPAPPHGSYPDNFRGFSYTFAHNLSGCPGAVVRCGESAEGMPIGVQVVGAPWREDICLAVAAHLEEVFGGWKAPEAEA
jgi:amidase